MLTVTRKRRRRRRPIGCSAERGDGSGVHVRGRAHLERNPRVAHIGRQAAERGAAVWADHDVVDDADAVAEPLGVAPLDRLPDRGQAERLPGVQGGVEVLALHEMERVEVRRGRVARLGTGDVETGDPGVAIAHRELGDLIGACRLAHGCEKGADDYGAPSCRKACHGGIEPFKHRLDHLFEAEAPLCVQLRGEADLGVDDPVVRQVLDTLDRRRARAPRRSASRRRCGRSPPGSERGHAVGRRRRTRRRARRGPWSEGRDSPGPARARRRSRAGAHRRGGREAAPSAPLRICSRSGVELMALI